ncbi:thioredoxin family protein [Roseomonas marmotae]|uniref:Thioredoxin family protein n=1 Tax=Roseomonas marmotae TaxID=2768161 RepID=A0ABS3KFH7_9PROT|nr:thioredoxin family protein [Roseomonas marmotae]MBO1075096.1 thioredoxin family protein [Roseomonas marmotae]QTI79788.1 thioredoxin family protein [Roseomonas marmotae]
MPFPLRRRALLAAAGSLPLLPRAAWAVAPRIDAPAPAFSLPDQDGRTHSLADYRGKTVVLEWTNHECPFVRKHYSSGNMQRFQKEATERGIVWLSIVSSPPGEQGHVTPEEARALTAEREASPAAVLLDPRSQVARAYGATTTPHLYVIDAEGLLRYMGGIDSIPSARVEDIARAKPLARDAMLAVAEGRRVEQPVTRNYGCAIKYAPAV